MPDDADDQPGDPLGDPLAVLLEETLQRRGDRVRSVRVEVSPGVVRGRRPSARVLVAALAVAAVAVTAGVVASATHGGRTSAPPLASPSSVPTIPSVLGRGRDDAQALLRAAGLRVSQRTTDGCTDPAAGVALGTKPPAGQPAVDGERVVLSVSAGQEADGTCHRGGYAGTTTPGRLMRFALGFAGPPPLADRVDLFVGAQQRTLTRAEATDPDRWILCDDAGACDSALTTLADRVLAQERFTGDPELLLSRIPHCAERYCSGGRDDYFLDVGGATSDLGYALDGSGRLTAVWLHPTGPRPSLDGPTGGLRGTLTMVGGPSGAPPIRVRSGTITLADAGPHGLTVVTPVAADGTWSVDRLAPGTYRVSGSTPQYNSDTGGCAPAGRVVVTAHRQTRVPVYCSRR